MRGLMLAAVATGLIVVATPAHGQQVDQYEPSDTHPFGRAHPDAPPELSQFEFMIGLFDCVDEIRQPDGSRVSFPATWGAHYFLNGRGVQDEYFSPQFATSNIRIFDPDEGVWVITFFRMPGYQSGIWKGGLEGDSLVFRNAGRTSGPGLTFYDRTAEGFEWKSGGDDPGWTSSCRRRE